MHYSITSMIGAQLHVYDQAFFLGGLAPDLHSYMGTSHYYVSHFAFKNEQGKTLTNYEQYRSKYLVGEISPFHLGYYFHLISDDVWKREVYYKKVKHLPSEARREVLQKNYRDFWRLNGMIIDHFSLDLRDLRSLDVAMEEIDSRHFPQLISALHRDFELRNEASGEELELLDFDKVLGVLNKSVEACLDAYSVLIRNTV